jgi:hypothetical protein
MKKAFYTFLCFALVLPAVTFAGNPDRQGEAGAPELLLNPWARSAGLHGMTTASVTGVEAMRINVAGLSRVNKGEIAVANTRLYEGTGIGINALGFSTKVGTGGALGVSLMSMDFGELPVTTTDQPEGTGADFSPSFINIGVGYSYTYENKISVGVLFRAISQSAAGVSASGFAIDAGVQYVSGPKDNFKLGISLRNIGSSMAFGGDGLTQRLENPDSEDNFNLTFQTRSEDFELPSTLNIGLAYDYYFSDDLYLRGVGNFTSNSFGSDQIGAGLELSWNDMVQLRGGYEFEIDENELRQSIYDGVSAGLTVLAPMGRDTDTKMAIDYAYRTTRVFEGTHNITLRLAI